MAESSPAQRRIAWTDDSWKVAAAVLIGLSSLVGAFVTYTAVRFNEDAVDADRRSVVETAAIEQERADAAVQVSAEQAAAARYRALLAEADVLAELPARGDLRDERTDRVRLQQALALRQASFTFDSTFLRGDGDDAVYDVEGRTAALLAQNQDVAQLDPDRTATQADVDHRRSVRQAGWVVAFVALIGILSLAQLVSQRLRPPIVLSCAVALIVFAVAAVVNAR